MNTLSGYSKSTLTDNFVLTAAGGHLAVGNADKNIPLNNGTVCTNLNADKVDGKNATDFLLYYEKNYGANISNVKDIDTTLTSGLARIHISNVEYSSVLTGYDYNSRYWQLRFVPGAAKGLYYRNTTSGTEWQLLAFVSDIPTVTNYYWANVKIKSSEDKTTTPTFGGLSVTGESNLRKTAVVGTSAGETSINANLDALVVASATTRVTASGTYYPGIALTHMWNFDSAKTYLKSPQAWIGTRLFSTEGSERSALVFATKGTTGTLDRPTERMCITHDGNVGIGTKIPSGLLHVNGVIKAVGTTNTYDSSATAVRTTINTSDGIGRIYTYDETNSIFKKLYVGTNGASAIVADTNNYIGIGVDSPENKLDVNGVLQVYIRGARNNAFDNLLLLKQQNSSEGAGQAWDESYPSFGIGFRRYWTDGTSPYGETTCAGIYATVSSAWRGGLVFRTKNNTTNGGTHDITALKLRPDGVAVFANYVYTPSGFVHSGYNSSAHALTSNGGVAKIADMSVNYANSAGAVAWGNITGKPSSFTPSSHTHTYIESKAYYTFTSSTLPNSFDWGVSAGFVASDSGFGSFGSVLTVRTYSGGGGTLQLYAPYSNTYGGSRLKARFGNYDSNTGNSWTTLKEIAWVGDIPTKVSLLTNDSGYITSYKNTWYGDGLWAPSTNITLNATSNGQEWSFDIYRNGKTGCYWHVWDNALSTLLKVNADDGKVSAPYGFVGNLSGTASSASSASVANEARVLCADETMKLYANHSNEVNFGGTNTSGTIYFGYRATDSKPVPTSFVFGDSTGSATLTSSGFKKKGSSDSYVLLGAGGHKALSDFSMAHSHSYHPLGGSWKPSSLSSYTRHWGWAYSTAEAGLASDGGVMQIYTDGKFWQREGAYYCLDNGNTYVSSGTGVINGTTITQVSNASTATASYYVYDYNATTTPIYIGYAGAALSTATHFAAYGTTSSGARCIKDIPVATVKSLLGIPSVSSRNLTVNGTAYTFYSNTTTAAASFYAPTSVGTSGLIVQSYGNGAPSWVNRLTYDYPGVIWVGYIDRSYSSTTWSAHKSAGSASLTFTLSNAATYKYLQVTLSGCTAVLGAFCSTREFYDGGYTLASSATETTGRTSGMGDYQVACSGLSVYIKKFNLGDLNNDTWRNNGLYITTTGDGNKPVTSFYLVIIGY